MSNWDHASHEQFYEYYAKASQSPPTLQRLRSIQDCILRIVARESGCGSPLNVADIGCGAGAQSLMWAELGHQVHGLDVNEPLVDLARKRAVEAGWALDFRVGSAVDLPWASESMDVCLMLELLEHVVEWQACLDESARIVRPGGILFLTTTNRLCPVQQEFNLPAYSWYPSPLKRHYEHLAVTTRPELVNFAKYPAVNWFSFYDLRAVLAGKGFVCLDRFDLMDVSRKNTLARRVIAAVRAAAPLRWLAHVATSDTTLLAVKRTRNAEQDKS